MKITVGKEIKIGGKKRMIVEIQTDAFDWQRNEICFDDKSRMTQLELVKAYNSTKDYEYAYHQTFDHMFNHACPSEDCRALWIYNKLKVKDWKSVVNLKHVYLDGMIPKKDLVDGFMYGGYCRNAVVAKWHADIGRFEYVREKFGNVFKEKIVHPEDDEGHDIFVPTLKFGTYEEYSENHG